MPTGRPVAPLQPVSKNWPYELQLSQLANLTWHYTDPPPPPLAQIIRNTRSQTLTTPLSPPSSFCGAHLELLQHDCHTTLEETIWAERGALSLCGCGMERWTQTHVSVICRSVFHQWAVQGLRNACSVLPGLSACRLGLLTAALGQTHEDEPPSFITTATTRWLPCHRPSQH